MLVYAQVLTPSAVKERNKTDLDVKGVKRYVTVRKQYCTRLVGRKKNKNNDVCNFKQTKK